MTAPSLGIFLPSLADHGTPPGDMAGAARHAEDLEFESVWAVDQLVAGTGAPIIERLAGYRDSGATRLVATIAGGDWHRQADLLAEAYRMATT